MMYLQDLADFAFMHKDGGNDVDYNDDNSVDFDDFLDHEDRDSDEGNCLLPVQKTQIFVAVAVVHNWLRLLAWDERRLWRPPGFEYVCASFTHALQSGSSHFKR